MKKYYPVLKTFNEAYEATHLKIEVKYEIGGYSYATHRETRRGYYVYVTPVRREDKGTYTMESACMFTGFKSLVKEVKRKSNKSLLESEEIFIGDRFKALEVMIKNSDVGTNYAIDLDNPID